MPVTFVTDLPDVTELDIDATETSVLTPEWDDVLNNGQYRTQLRDDDPDGDHPDWGEAGEAIINYTGDAEHTFSDLFDGERYSVRVRTETDYADGGWLIAEGITNFPAPTDVTAIGVSTTSVTVGWTDNANFKGSHQLWRRREDWNYEGFDDWQLVTTVSDSDDTADDNTVAPASVYEYIVRARTQWVHADTAGAVAETDAINAGRRRVPPRGWRVEVDHATGRTRTPQLLDAATRQPTINGFPRVEIPVEQSETWQAEAFDDADMRVWFDGYREPIEQLEHRRVEPDRAVLEGRGGTQLDRRVIEDVEQRETHVFIEELIEEYTDYTPDVDDPDAGTIEDVTLQAPTGADELGPALAGEFDDDVPLTATDQGIEPLQSGFLFDAQDGFGDDALGSAYNEGEALEINSEIDSYSESFEVDYRIPADVVDIRVRIGIETDGEHAAFEILFDGEVYDSVPEDVLDAGVRWFDTGATVDEDIGPGTHTIEVRGTPDTGSAPLVLDMVAVHDGRFEYFYDDDIEGDDDFRVSGPELYPDKTLAEFVEISSPISISSAAVTVDADSADGSIPEIGILTPAGEFDTASNADQHEVVFDELSTTTQVRLGLGRHGEGRTDYPTDGYLPEVLTGFELTADLDDTPVLTNRSFDDRLINVLQEVADIGNFVFAITQDGDDTVVEVTRLEGRQSSVEPDMADYSIDVQTEDVVDRAIIYGGAQRITRQFVDVATDAWVDLPFEGKIVEGQVEITDEAGEETFARGEDFELRHTTEAGVPQLRALGDGDLVDGQTIRFAGDVKPRGEFAVDGAGEDPRTIVEDLPGLASQQMCEQVALYLVEETGDAVKEVDLTVPHDAVEWSVIEAIDVDALPGDGPWQTREITHEAGQTTLQLANRQSVGEVLEDIRSGISRNSERV